MLILKADRARIYQGLLGCPGKSAFGDYINNNLLLNCNITLDGINRAENIYGEETPILQGNVRKNKLTANSNIYKIPLPLPIS